MESWRRGGRTTDGPGRRVRLWSGHGMHGKQVLPPGAQQRVVPGPTHALVPWQQQAYASRGQSGASSHAPRRTRVRACAGDKVCVFLPRGCWTPTTVKITHTYTTKSSDECLRKVPMV